MFRRSPRDERALALHWVFVRVEDPAFSIVEVVWYRSEIFGVRSTRMLPRRYSVILANRATGVTRRFTFRARPAVGLLVAVIALPLVWILYAGSLNQAHADRLSLRNAQLEIEVSSYRAAAVDLTAQIATLQAAMADLAPRVDMDPLVLRSLERLPAIHSRALATAGAEMPPGRAFDVLDGLLGTLERKLDVIRQGVAYREALAAATPALWPADGWISGTYGYRSDPFTGLRDFHAAVDISTRKGQPVNAPATGRVMSAASNGAYGNLVELDHGFGLTTRYGHLSGFAVRVGETVRRGQLIGYVGATGRATGSHVHYEVWVNGRTINPMRLLERRPVAAN